MATKLCGRVQRIEEKINDQFDLSVSWFVQVTVGAIGNSPEKERFAMIQEIEKRKEAFSNYKLRRELAEVFLRHRQQAEIEAMKELLLVIREVSESAYQELLKRLRAHQGPLIRELVHTMEQLELPKHPRQPIG